MAKQNLNQGRCWYVLHTYSGYEENVAQSLRQRMSTILQETGSMPDRTEVKEDLLRLYEETLNIELVPGRGGA